MENQNKDNRFRRYIGRLALIFIMMILPLSYFYLNGKSSWTMRELVLAGSVFMFYWMGVFFLAGRLLRNKQALTAINLASPLIELPLNADVRAKLSAFATARHQTLAVAAFELLHQELPRFDQEDELERARRDNEHLRQQAGQGAFLVAVTTEILKRLLLLSGAQEEDRKVWRTHISETAARIVDDALDHQHPLPEGL
jgi:hypothetical protein